MEFEAVDEGTVGKILIGEGTEGVKVNTPIAVLLEEGESADAIGSAPAPAPTTAAPSAPAEPRRSLHRPSMARQLRRQPATASLPRRSHDELPRNAVSICRRSPDPAPTAGS